MEGAKPKTGDLVGRTFGEFVVREQLGTGGFGTVYRAEQPALAREAVVKVLHMRLLGSETLVQRFLREARLASRLDHPYAAHTYAFGAETDGVLWIAMEYVRGTPLDRLLEAQGPIALERFVPLLERICEVVQTAHEQGIVHRDLKPANVMVLSRAGRLLPKLLDFGIAKLDDGTIDEPLPLRPGGSTTASSLAESGAFDVTAAPEALLDATIPSAASPSTPRLVSTGRVSDHDTGGRLTNVGASMGSPLYMAPEQWSDAGAVDARTDIYALGILCFECLTGDTPFRGATQMQIALAHAKQAVPPLPGEHPRGLDAVIAKALAKEPQARYQTALELAAAFRAASGVVAEVAPLPRLDDAQRLAAQAGAPRPIARALDLLDAARNPHQARDALWQVVHTAVRVVGVAALASHSHVGAARTATDPGLSDGLRALRGRALSDGAWLDLARSLVRPFAELRDAHPIPELVELLDHRRPAPALAGLVAMRAAADEAGGGSDDRVRELLERALPLLARALDELSFFNNYIMVVPGDEGAEDWMGVRRADRPRRALTGPRAVSGHPVLLDADGAPAVSLWPFVQVHEPSPGAPRELFFFEGKGRRGARLVALPDGFEHEDEGLWESLGSMLRDTEDRAGGAVADEASPFPGLASFTADHASSFFGRERETEAFLNRLRVTPLLAVVGPSGAGKSSFVQAGVIPALPEGWRALTLRPGPAPLVALASRLGAAGIDAVDLPRELPEHPGALGSVLRVFAGKTATSSGGAVVLVVDQLEELFTLCEDAREREVFAEALVRAARSPDDPVRVVVTLRDDFLLRAEAVPAFRSRLGQSLQLLTTPAAPDLRRILTLPVQRAGYEFDDPALPDEMVEAVASASGALALLSFTASKLWELRDRRFRQIAHKAYKSLGGVGGALAQHAEATLQAMSAEEQRLAREVFRHAVTSEGTRAVLTRDELDQLLGGGAHAAAVVEKLVAARLLVVSEIEGDNERVEIIHEALLEAWPRLVSWRRDDAEGSRMRDQLRAAARQWDERDRPRGLLWRDDALLDYRRWRVLNPGNLTDVEAAFTEASERVEARGRRRKRVAAVSVFAVLLVAVVMLLWMNGRTERQRGAAVGARRSAEESLVRLQVELGREALLARDYARAAAYLGHAAERGVDTPALRFLLTQAARPLRQRPIVLAHGEKIGFVTFAPDGSRLVTAGEAEHAVVWSAEGKRLYDITLGGGEVIMAPRFSPDGRTLLLTGRGGTVGLWNAADGTLISRQKAHDFTVWTGAFSPDGARFATVSGDQLVKVWSTATVQPIAVLRGHEANVLDLAWSPDGTRLVTTGVDGTARVWDPARATLVRTLVGDRDHISRTVAISPDGALVALGSDRVIKVWRLADGALVTVLSGHAGPVEKLAFARDGRLASASWDGTAKVWNVTSGGLIASLEGHKGKVWSVAWSSDASRILTISEDGTGRLWDSRGVMLAILSGHSSDVEGGAIDPTGRLAATASFDGTARLWRLGVDTTVGLAAGHAGMVAEVRYSEDGSRLITTSRDRTARVWDVGTGIEIAHFDITFPVAWAASTGPDLTMAIAEDRVLNFLGRDGKPAGRIDLPISVDALESTRDGKRLLLMAQEGDVLLVDVETRAVRKLEVGPARWAAFAHHGPRIAVAHDDGRVEVWDSSTGARVLEVAAHDGGASRVQFCGEDGQLMSVGHDGAVKFWDTRNGALVRQTRLKPGYLAPLVSPDCAFLFSAGDGYPLAVLDATDGRLLDHIEVRSGETLNISMSPDGRHLAAAAGELAWTWDVAVERDLAPLLQIVRCAAPFRIEGSELVAAPRDGRCAQ